MLRRTAMSVLRTSNALPRTSATHALTHEFDHCPHSSRTFQHHALSRFGAFGANRTRRACCVHTIED
jgi:hypothetical protein